MKLCSIVIPTIGRQTLARSVESVLAQNIAPELYEIIVVNDSGRPLEGFECLNLPQISVVSTNRCKLGMARNVGAAVASGKHLYFLDDDDYLLPGGLMALLNVAELSDCSWVYGGVRCVNEHEEIVAEVSPQVTGNLFALLVAGESISVVVSVIRRETFFLVGGFDPLLECLEDRDFACRLALVSDFDRTDALVACCRVAHSTSTFDWTKAPSANRILREKALNAPHALARMKASIRGSARLRGRGCRAYVASAMVNSASGSHLKALSRVLSCVYLAGFHALSPQLWHGILRN